MGGGGPFASAVPILTTARAATANAVATGRIGRVYGASGRSVNDRGDFVLTHAGRPRYQREVRAVARVCLAVVGVPLAVFCVAEALLRVGTSPPRRGLSDVPVALTRYDRKRGYTLPPSAAIEYAGVRTTLNSWGLRGPLPEADGHTEVLALGDELTFGWGVPDDQSYPAQLGALLHRQHPSSGQVVNAGIPGYTSYQGLMLLREIGPRLRPRVVVASFHVNDALPDAVPSGAAGEWLERSDIGGWLQPRSAAYGWLWWFVHRPPREWWRIELRTPVTRYLRNLLAIAAEGHRMSAAVVFLNIGFGPPTVDSRAGPGQQCHRRGRFEGDYQVAMRAAAVQAGSAIAEVIGPELNADTMLDEIHPNAVTYGRIAERVARAIAESPFHL